MSGLKMPGQVSKLGWHSIHQGCSPLDSKYMLVNYTTGFHRAWLGVLVKSERYKTKLNLQPCELAHLIQDKNKFSRERRPAKFLWLLEYFAPLNSCQLTPSLHGSACMFFRCMHSQSQLAAVEWGKAFKWSQKIQCNEKGAHSLKDLYGQKWVGLINVIMAWPLF